MVTLVVDPIFELSAYSQPRGLDLSTADSQDLLLTVSRSRNRRTLGDVLIDAWPTDSSAAPAPQAGIAFETFDR